MSDNLLDRSFEAAVPNQKWIADFTHIWTTEGWLYVAAVVDVVAPEMTDDDVPAAAWPTTARRVDPTTA